MKRIMIVAAMLLATTFVHGQQNERINVAPGNPESEVTPEMIEKYMACISEVMPEEELLEFFMQLGETMNRQNFVHSFDSLYQAHRFEEPEPNTFQDFSWECETDDCAIFKVATSTHLISDFYGSSYELNETFVKRWTKVSFMDNYDLMVDFGFKYIILTDEYGDMIGIWDVSRNRFAVSE